MTTIREVYDRTLAGGLRADASAGADPFAIVRTADAQGAKGIPAAVEAVWRLVGGGGAGGLWWPGATTDVVDLDAEIKELALEALDTADGNLRDPKGLLVLLCREAVEFHVVEGSDLALPDPPVWRIVRDEPVERRWAAVTEWFAEAARGVLDHRDALRREIAEGGAEPTARYFDL
ncbi:hypothetical protein [Umezawaea sp.]|uniref:hypothetical protein n=1 Tax=Umezawaea sp. TaxID=1955258 RepID=UPI002ED0B439